ncbi:MAG: hypothetical protein Q9170_003925 [Blastenia crenularia]
MTTKQSTSPLAGGDSNPVDKGGLCLLSLDGGGVRGLSTLHILKRIMDQVNELRRKKGRPSRLPCEVFDMIGGTSTGGLIAIMLGRLGMTVDECIKVYEELMGSIFGSKAHWMGVSAFANINAQYDSNKAKAAILRVLHEHGLSEETPFNDGTERRCRVLVCCVAKETGTAVRIRSYNQNFDNHVAATIWQAALATSAATTFFEPVAIGPCKYVDGALRNNNPVVEVETEAQRIWCSDQGNLGLHDLVKCFLSIGTGMPAKLAISDNIFGLLNNLKTNTTDTEAVNKHFMDRWRRHLINKRLFRFDVAHGLQGVELADYKKQAIIIEATNEYVNEAAQQMMLQGCTENLIHKELRGTPLDFHETVSRYTIQEIQGNYDIKQIRDCHAVLRVTDVEKDRCNLQTNKGARVPGTFGWITSNPLYQDWQGSGPDTLWIAAGPGRGKTMLALYILEELERYISRPTTLPALVRKVSALRLSNNILASEQGKKADLYYFFCSDEDGSRRDALAVFRSLIYQIVRRHEDLMKHVLDYLENNRPIHADEQPDNESEKQSRKPDKKEQQFLSSDFQGSAEQRFPAQAKFVKSLLPGARKQGQSEKELENRPKNKSPMFQNMLGRREKQLKNEPEEQKVTEPESLPADRADPPERDSPKSRQLELLEVTELSFILRKLIRELGVDTVYFLLDGVDECIRKEQEALTSTMLKLRDVQPGKFKLLMVSRPIGGMGKTPTIRLEEMEETTGDIEKFISKSVEQLANIEGFKDIQQEVEQNLLEGADGTFLWVSLVMREIEKSRTCTEILAATKSVPQGLNNKYSHMLQHVNPVDQQTVARLLCWAAAAIRPLTLQELSEVIEVPSFSSMSAEQAVRDAITSAEGLLKIRGDEVTLVHASAKDFLLLNGPNNHGAEGAPIKIELWHYELAQACYNDILRCELSRTKRMVSELSDKEEPKLLKYAIKHWMEHVKASDWAEPNFNPDAEFFAKVSPLRKNWWTAYLEDSQNDDPQNFNVGSLTHCAAYFGIVEWIKPAYDGKGWIQKKAKVFMDLDHYNRTPLHIAVEQGHCPVVSLLLDQGVDIEFREASLFATPLHLAARNGHKNICEILLEHKARINARNRFDSTPLTEAARGGHLEVVELLVRRGADINGSIDKKQRSLYRHVENVPGYYKRQVGKIDGLTYAERSTPVIEAARKNHATIIRHLVRHGANIEAKTLAGFPALHIAAYHGQLRSLEVLVELGANIEKKDDSTHTALFMASWQNHPDVIQWLLDHDANSESTTGWGFTPLLVASRNGYMEPMRILLKAQAKIEHRDKKGSTSLMLAAKFGKVAGVKLLIEHNAKINAQDHFGNTALMYAIREDLTDELVETVQLLLEHGADVNHQNHDGLTPLMEAADLSHGDAPSIVQYLLEKGAVIDTRDDEGSTALMYAAINGATKTQGILLDNGAALEAKDYLGDTALIYAAGFSDKSAVEFLLERGADIEARNNFGFTSLHKAARCGWLDVISLLLDRGAQMAAVDNEGKTAIDHAATRERGDVIKLLKTSGASGHNLTVRYRAAATLSKVISWPVDKCRGWERDWEIAEAKKLDRKASDGAEDASIAEQGEEEVASNKAKSTDVESAQVDTKPVDEDISAEKQAPQEIEGTRDDDVSDAGLARTGTSSTAGSMHSSSE